MTWGGTFRGLLLLPLTKRRWGQSARFLARKGPLGLIPPDTKYPKYIVIYDIMGVFNIRGLVGGGVNVRG